MPPTTVIVPEAMEELFAKAESVVSSYFSKRRDQPEVGTIEIFEDRYVLVRGAAQSVVTAGGGSLCVCASRSDWKLWRAATC